MMHDLPFAQELNIASPSHPDHPSYKLPNSNPQFKFPHPFKYLCLALPQHTPRLFTRQHHPPEAHAYRFGKTTLFMRNQGVGKRT
ncbi:hypothetical protein HBH98_084440 [Parastagonospora nodorum]|nr:hypothetical protein HBH50_152340 [Parastagonospora nodorum]KAH4079462.1 hypothetical protein HBH48_219120 [Parastagonospora nodorum]KAH4116011.1 hypothetical protein HBH47_173090 [Parastagonospora nodorum]KAH4347714.1 hypothetical protein HBH98_084440 [Parastagonospora nodorum]KAH4360683.1 hypothetical protein HBH97_203720 [Parastagonospora nodorum]